MRPPKRKITKCERCGKGMFWWAGRRPKFCNLCFREHRRQYERERQERRLAAARQEREARA
jgi:hypothetical protein